MAMLSRIKQYMISIYNQITFRTQKCKPAGRGGGYFCKVCGIFLWQSMMNTHANTSRRLSYLLLWSTFVFAKHEIHLFLSPSLLNGNILHIRTRKIALHSLISDETSHCWALFNNTMFQFGTFYMDTLTMKMYCGAILCQRF